MMASVFPVNLRSAAATAVEAPQRAHALEEGRALLREGKYGDAEALARKRLPEAEAHDGADSLEVAEVLDVLVESLWRGGKASQPETQALADRAVAIKERVLGAEHPEIAASVSSLAITRVEAGDHAGARSLFQRALSIRERASGRDHPSVASSLNALANLLQTTGDYQGARPLYERAAGIQEKSLGPAHPALATTLNNLAGLLFNAGDYAGARPLHERALSIRETALGPDHPDVAQSLNNLGNLHNESGDYMTARRFYERSLAIREKSLGPGHPLVASTLTNLSNLLSATEDYEGARAVLERALAIREKALGPEHPLVATTVQNLADGRARMGDHAAAGPLYERARAIFEKALGPEHPLVASSLHGLATLLAESGDTKGGRILHERALGVREKALGPQHPAVAESLEALARLPSADAAGRERTLELALRAEDVSRAHLRLTARTLSERQALAYASKRPSGLGRALHLAAEGLDPAERQNVWDAVIRSRGLVLDEMAARHRAAGRSEDEVARRLVSELLSARQQLANLIVRGQSGAPETYRRLLEEAQLRREKAERALAEAHPPFRVARSRERMGLAEIGRALPAGSALVGFVRYEAPSQRRYLAFVLADRQRQPEVVSLGPAEELDALVRRWRDEIRTAPSTRGGEGRYRATGRALRERIWDPIAARLRGSKQVFLVPDGSLSLVSFAALPVGTKQYLVESGPLVHYLSAEADLIAVPRQSKAAGLLVVGAPAFDDASVVAAHAGPSIAPPHEPGSFRGQRSSCGSFHSVRFRALPAAAQEAEMVASIWDGSRHANKPASGGRGGVLKLTGASADEASLKAHAPRHRVLHLATHGFFLGQECSTPGTPTAAEKAGPGENPLVLSGLAFAGANHRELAGHGNDDGVLTAEEVAALDLSGTEWAVLSACDTGVGEVMSGEGVFGLRRAFQIAGVRTLIMTLWPVEDESARQWMTALYRARWQENAPTAAAVRQASLEALRSSREAGDGHPFYWAAFVAVGEWR